MSRKLTIDEVNDQIADRGFVVVGAYLGANTRNTFRCSNSHEWLAFGSSVLRGSGCPHCAGQARLNAELVNQRIADRQIALIGKYVNKETKTNFQCANGHVWQAYPGHVMRGSGCPTCAGKAPLTAEIVNLRLSERGIRLVGEYNRALSHAMFEGVCGHSWRTSPSTVMSGGGCPLCAGNMALTTRAVSQRLSLRGIELIGEYTRAQDRGTFKASCGHTWKALYSNVLGGSGCPICTPRGFRRDDPAILYLIAFRREAGDIFKIGVTNNDLKTRYANETHDYCVISQWHFDLGSDAEKLERKIVQALASYKYSGPSPLRNTATSEMFETDVSEIVFRLVSDATQPTGTLKGLKIPDGHLGDTFTPR